MRRATTLAAVAAATGLAAVSGVAGTSGGSGDPAPAAFRLDDSSAGCRVLDGGTLACRAVGVETAVVLDPDGRSRAENVEVDWDEATPVLLASESWWHGAFSCRVRSGIVTCAAGDGAITVERGALGGVR